MIWGICIGIWTSQPSDSMSGAGKPQTASTMIAVLMFTQDSRLTHCPLSDVAAGAAETRCKKIRDLRAETGQVRLNNLRQRGEFAEECSDRPPNLLPAKVDCHSGRSIAADCQLFW